MKKVCIQVGHWGIENITSESLRSWRSADVLKRSTGASGERIWHWNKWMPLLKNKLIAAGVQVFIVGATYQKEIYDQEYDLWISGHYDGGGTGERCMISSPNRATAPSYLNSGAFSEAERFCSIWKGIYPAVVGVPNRDNFITAGMRDYYAFDYVGYNTPAVIVEHFNHTSPKGTQLKQDPEKVAEGDFKAIMKFLGIDKPVEPTPDPLAECIALNEKKSNDILEITAKLVEAENFLKISQDKNSELKAKVSKYLKAEALWQSKESVANRKIKKLEDNLVEETKQKNEHFGRYKDARKEIIELKKIVDVTSYSTWDLLGIVFSRIKGSIIARIKKVLKGNG